MPRYRHPRAREDAPGYPPARVHVSRGDKRPVADDGTFEAPESVAEAIAAGYDTTADAMRVAETETCDVVKADGEVCGRELPCPYHSEDE